MDTVRSKDGTVIAFDRSGEGPPLILVDGALCSRALGPMPKLATQLAGRFTVFHYDRRGRGDSSDAMPYAVEREIEDIEALIGVAGGPVYLYGVSSGAALALEAANRGLPIDKVVVVRGAVHRRLDPAADPGRLHGAAQRGACDRLPG